MLNADKQNEMLGLFGETMRVCHLCPSFFDRVLTWTGEDYEYGGIVTDQLSSYTDNIAFGASKLVIALNAYPDWVFKIPFQGEYYYSAYDGKRDYSRFCDVGRDLCLAHRASFDKDEWDYCYLESEITKEIEKYNKNIVDMFAKTYYLGNYGSIPVYASERCDADWYTTYLEVKKSTEYEESRTLCSNSPALEAKRGQLSISQQATFIVSHGLVAANALFDFINTTNISDLHSANMAYDKDNKVRLIDYSGYRDCY